MSSRTGMGYDSHRFEPGERFILGGVEIPDVPFGTKGHSDADALAHAVIDALLGAAGLGDIGFHFPDNDERWRDADSLELLAQTCRLLGENGFAVDYVDTTVICERPKLGPFRDEMRRTLARTIGVPVECVSVKFKTNEGLGWIGSGEGIAAFAVATVERDA
jgi:2-C-methyl-D-erythritol 2,4-cyclodiphosphate synthase